jgi:hypothetical protein
MSCGLSAAPVQSTGPGSSLLDRCCEKTQRNTVYEGNYKVILLGLTFFQILYKFFRKLLILRKFSQ